ncbi:MAG: hypothetical protein IIW92_12655 [Lachnospiraceae bacterium]|nr:hypothetical protein [Lachnospiraceae bacterium]MBQ5919405.1 hypothetical protein [Lachnospiraceae bacterium]
MFEYRLNYHWDTEHWTCIASGDMLTDIDTYINKHLAEMQEAIVTGEEYFSVIQYYDGEPVRKWQGSLEELCVYIRETTDDWLSKAFT